MNTHTHTHTHTHTLGHLQAYCSSKIDVKKMSKKDMHTSNNRYNNNGDIYNLHPSKYLILIRNVQQVARVLSHEGAALPKQLYHNSIS